MFFGKTRKERIKKSLVWSRWFAWFTVELEDFRIAWLCWIERRPWGDRFQYYDYRRKP